MTQNIASEKTSADEVENRIIELENEVESLFYAFHGYRLRRKILEEIVESAVCEYFEINRRDFINTVLKNRHFTSLTSKEKDLVEARKWFTSLMRYILEKNSYTLKLNYQFYNIREDHKHRPIFMSAQNPITAQDKKNRELLLGVSAIVKRMCKEEEVAIENFAYL
jgi:hypothetical protein